MSQILKVCRLGSDWAMKDATGSFYCRSSNLDEVKAYAEKWASRLGARVVVRDERGEEKGTAERRQH
ncbi:MULTISPECIES: hypothetical protein [unclassified Bosea (in: a-proteobacteria)]|uniref:hypothetical protein n=1 Tax=unclassified Bosea (in: a-proteobacteria) TaxID=2653178 RepID=UPI000F7E11AC|nr:MULTISPECIES: hypothetical protein [unclassified Bosea (in: a-proteobacteria)]